jgi:hypothetical protein
MLAGGVAHQPGSGLQSGYLFRWPAQNCLKYGRVRKITRTSENVRIYERKGTCWRTLKKPI